jgi:Derlin-1
MALALCSFLVFSVPLSTTAKRISPSSLLLHGQHIHSSLSREQIQSILSIRAGASKKRPSRTASLSSKTSTPSKLSATGKKKVAGGATAVKKEGGGAGDLVKKYQKILPLTRLYITLVGLSTLVGVVLGEETAQAVLALDPARVLTGFEFWRPFTAASFLGPPSIGWLMSGYYLFEYGSTLERAYGTAQHAIFLLSQVVVLSIMSILTGQPFFAQSAITAMLHVLSRAMPHQKVKWLVFTVPYWSLPYGLMASDVLQQQNAMAALPHVLGILSGHFYHFHKFVWPKMGGVDWLAAPPFLQRFFQRESSKSKESIDKALKSRKKQRKGRKLGSATTS